MKALVTGFEPYGGRELNPATEVMRALDGTSIGATSMVGRRLPVSYELLPRRLDEILDEVQPEIAISLGLWPGEPMIRLERLAANVADFEIPDNEGTLLEDATIAAANAPAHFATLPLRRIEKALLDKGIPARVSSTAGTFLCNATLFTLLSRPAERNPAMRCGFIHLPYLPSQVAAFLQQQKRERKLELHQRADLASMDLATMVDAVRTAIAVTAAELSGDAPPR
jgi:pyroglutamyl-peptidase